MNDNIYIAISLLVIRFPHASHENLLAIQYDMIHNRADWSVSDLVEFYSCTEELNPSLREELACERMRVIIERNAK